MRTWQRFLLYAVAAALLALVFGWYLEPDFMLTVADQIWACF